MKSVSDTVKRTTMRKQCIDPSKYTTCEMLLRETDDGCYMWECSVCDTLFDRVEDFEKNMTCPDCKASIVSFECL
jgi:rubredoxin